MMEDGAKLLHGDCLDILPTLPDGCADMICADLPYGMTNCSWDKLVPLEPLWRELWRVAKHNAAVCMFAQQPFATDLINSARKFFRYEWVWVKTIAGGNLNANRMPLRSHELILVFYRKMPKYNPQFRETERLVAGTRVHWGSHVYGKTREGKTSWQENGLRYPRDVVTCMSMNHANMIAPTEKPVPLLEMLAETYTDAGETILDPTMGSGSMGVACVRTGRRFVGIEKDAHFFGVAKERIAHASGGETEADMGDGRKGVQGSLF